MSEILYPFALGEDGGLTAVADAVRGGAYTCAGCSGAMIPKRGAIRQSHFSHKSVTDAAACEPGDTVHNLAILAIVDGHAKARANGRSYLLTAIFKDCPHGPSKDLAASFENARAEYPIVEGARADVAFVNERERWAVEVVVTHDLEPATEARYKAAGIRFARVKLEFDGFGEVEGLRSGISIPMSGKCETCERKSVEREERRRIADERRERERRAREIDCRFCHLRAKEFGAPPERGRHDKKYLMCIECRESLTECRSCQERDGVLRFHDKRFARCLSCKRRGANESENLARAMEDADEVLKSAKAQADRIVVDANERASWVILNAKAQASGIIADAKAQAARLESKP